MSNELVTPDLIFLDWPAPSNVKACTTLREPGTSKPPYDTFNLALHVGDDKQAVIENRRSLSAALKQDSIHWLNQIHSTEVIQATSDTLISEPLSADASFTREKHQICCVMTADCLPVFFCNKSGSQVAIAHAGWRGLCDGILQRTLATFDQSDTVMAYFGPAISQSAFEVGNDVRDSFLNAYPDIINLESCFKAKASHKWMADLYGLAKSILNHQGVTDIYGDDCCTFLESDHYFSYRRDGVTGRMAHLIWLDAIKN
ncbi:MAG: peptidoglycan editing factor PgeF [Cellvibrionaceae bacterium]